MWERKITLAGQSEFMILCCCSILHSIKSLMISSDLHFLWLLVLWGLLYACMLFGRPGFTQCKPHAGQLQGFSRSFPAPISCLFYYQQGASWAGGAALPCRSLRPVGSTRRRSGRPRGWCRGYWSWILRCCCCQSLEKQRHTSEDR